MIARFHGISARHINRICVNCNNWSHTEQGSYECFNVCAWSDEAKMNTNSTVNKNKRLVFEN